jgi:TPR repeat protein
VGERVGVLRLLALRGDPRLDLVPDDRDTADLYLDLIELAGIAYVPDVLDRLQFENDAVQGMIYDVVDPRALYTEAAAAGNASAQLELARIVLRDDPGPGALDRYSDLLTQAAEQGQAEAMLLLSQAYSYGLGVEPSLENSRMWLLRSAEAGNTEAAATVRLLTQGETSE